jgi:transposase InsO family protein
MSENKITQKKNKLPVQINDTPDVVWQKCSLDIVRPLTQTLEGHKYLLTFQDELSKYTVAAPIQHQDAMTVARVFVQEIVLKFGIPKVLLTDQGSNFLSDLFAKMCKLLRIKRMKIISYGPQTNGSNERAIESLYHTFVVTFLMIKRSCICGSLMPLLYSIPLLTPVPGSHLTSFFSVENSIYRL